MNPEELLNAPETVQVYRLRVAHPTESAERIAVLAGLTIEQVIDAESALIALGLLRESLEGGYTAISPDRAADRLLRRTELEIAHQHVTLAGARNRLHALTEHYLEARSMRAMKNSVEHIHGLDNIRALIDELARTATSSVCALVPVSRPASRPVTLVPSALPLDREMLARGLSVRYILEARLRLLPRAQEYGALLTEAGGGLRIVEGLPTRLLIYDGTSALVPMDPIGTGAGAVLVREPAVLEFLGSLFEQLWVQGTSFFVEPDPSDPPPADTEHDVLQAIAAGKTNAAIARELGISPRTVTRLVSELMHRLGTESRFQAGVRAVQLGWIT